MYSVSVQQLTLEENLVSKYLYSCDSEFPYADELYSNASNHMRP